MVTYTAGLAAVRVMALSRTNWALLFRVKALKECKSGNRVRELPIC